MGLQLVALCEDHEQKFKQDMKAAFQRGAVDEFGEMKEEILPESHIDRSLMANGAIAYEAVYDGNIVGGAIVIIDDKTQHNHLDFLYVKVGEQSRGVGQVIWKSIEEMHPETKIWETCTPYFEKRNIHFYVNCFGFHIVEFFNKYHRDPNDHEDDFPDIEYFEGMFRFEKYMNSGA